jgi:hypothetical protein
VKLRRGTAGDIPQLLEVKHSRRLGEQTSGGFLLGSDAAGYLQQVEHGQVWVLDAAGGILSGFATTLGASAFAASPLYTLKDQVAWSTDVSATLKQPVGYFDQLAVRAGVSSRAAARLAFVALWELFSQGAHAVVSTTVSAPIRNLASIPFIERVGGRAVGQVAETYPEVGDLVSTVWLFTFDEVHRRVKEQGAFGRFLAASVAAPR